MPWARRWVMTWTASIPVSPTSRTTRPRGSWTPAGAVATLRTVGSRPRCGRASLADFPGQPRVRDQLSLLAGGRAASRRPAGPRPAVRSSGAGQDLARHDHRCRAGAAHPDHQRSGHPARRRSGGRAVLAGGGRGALPGRDPPDGPSGRGDALPGDGGFPGRHHRRQGPGGHRHPPGAAAVHRGRGDHARGSAPGAAA